MLINKQYKSTSKLSRYTTVPIYYNTDDELYQYGLSYWLDDTTMFINHTIEPGDSLDSLALYYYQNPTYFWIIADFNHFDDCFKELVVGDTIKIPTFSDIRWR